MPERAKNILITGGTGLVGKALQEVYGHDTFSDERWFFVGSKDADLTYILYSFSDFEECKKLFEKTQPSIVIHLAAKVGGLFRNMRSNAEMLSENIRLNDNVLRCCLLFDVQKVISCLSTCIYPENITSYPFDETIIHNGPPHASNYGYAYAKRILEVQSR